MLGEYLRQSSVHGLRYLSESKGTAFRLVWFACIAASFSLATYTIYHNILNWEDSPAIITKAQPVLIKESNLPAPMITICPQQPDFKSLVINYLNKYYTEPMGSFFEPLDVALKKAFLQNNVWNKMAKEYDIFTNMDIGENNPFEVCYSENNHEEKKCDFVRLLNTISQAELYKDNTKKCTYNLVNTFFSLTFWPFFKSCCLICRLLTGSSGTFPTRQWIRKGLRWTDSRRIT